MISGWKGTSGRCYELWEERPVRAGDAAAADFATAASASAGSLWPTMRTMSPSRTSSTPEVRISVGMWVRSRAAAHSSDDRELVAAVAEGFDLIVGEVLPFGEEAPQPGTYSGVAIPDLRARPTSRWWSTRYRGGAAREDHRAGRDGRRRGSCRHSSRLETLLCSEDGTQTATVHPSRPRCPAFAQLRKSRPPVPLANMAKRGDPLREVIMCEASVYVLHHSGDCDLPSPVGGAARFRDRLTGMSRSGHQCHPLSASARSTGKRYRPMRATGLTPLYHRAGWGGASVSASVRRPSHR